MTPSATDPGAPRRLRAATARAILALVVVAAPGLTLANETMPPGEMIEAADRDRGGPGASPERAEDLAKLFRVVGLIGTIAVGLVGIRVGRRLTRESAEREAQEDPGR